MSTQVVVLEQPTLTAPFGVRFWDVAVAAPAEPGLTVVAYPNSFPELRTAAIAGRSGVYSFSGLPGLRDAENGAGDDAFWAANPPVVPYTVQVADPWLRYLPFQFSASLPVRGLFANWDSPLSALTPSSDWLPIFSTPSRVLPGPAGVIHATLQDDASDSPAAWALLSVEATGVPAVTALADEHGTVSLFQPYPEPTGSGTTSPLSAPNLISQVWPITVSVFYSRIQAVNNSPDLDQLRRQRAGFIWRDSDHSSSIEEFQLSFGNELVLRSLDASSGRPLPVLLVTSASSPL